MSEVRIWEEDVVIPTYEAGKADRNPMFDQLHQDG